MGPQTDNRPRVMGPVALPGGWDAGLGRGRSETARPDACRYCCRVPKPTEAVLDESDGLDWKTMVRCDRIHLLPKDKFQEKKGTVTEERRHRIARKLVEALRLPIHRY